MFIFELLANPGKWIKTIFALAYLSKSITDSNLLWIFPESLSCKLGLVSPLYDFSFYILIFNYYVIFHCMDVPYTILKICIYCEWMGMYRRVMISYVIFF